MSIDIVRGANNKPVSSKELDRLLSKQADLSGALFTGYPIISTPEGRHNIDAIFIGPDTGIVIFDLIEGGIPGTDMPGLWLEEEEIWKILLLPSFIASTCYP